MTVEQSPVDLLQRAARLVETALVLLDIREHECGECGRKKWLNRDEARAYELLTDTPNRIQRAVSWIDQSRSHSAAIGG